VGAKVLSAWTAGIQDRAGAEKRQYPGVAGKVVKRADSFEEDGDVYIGIRFVDDTDLIFVIASQAPKIGTAELLRWKDGESSVVTAYIKSRERHE
jgi:hypothetical protein